MADTKNTAETTPAAEPAKRGRKRVRDENGTDVRVFFSEKETEALQEARWSGRYEKLADLVKEQTLKGIGYSA